MTARRLLAGLISALLLTGILAAPPAQAATMYPSGVGADLGPTPTTLGVKPAAGEDPAGLQTGTEQGRNYWRTNQAANTSFFSFDVDHDYVNELNTDDVVVSVAYLDSGTGTLQLEYDAAADPQAKADDVQLKNTGLWQTGTFTLNDIEFAPSVHPSSSVRRRSSPGSPRARVTARRASSPGSRTDGRTGRPTTRPRRRVRTSST